MCRTASLFLLQRLKGSMPCDARDFNNYETRTVNTFFSEKQGAEGNSHNSERNIRGICTIFATVKNWVAKFKRGDLSTCVVPHPGRLKTVTTSEISDQIHELILEDCRISNKSISGQLGISRERVGSIIHEDLDMWKHSAEWIPKCVNADQKGHGAICLSNI